MNSPQCEPSISSSTIKEYYLSAYQEHCASCEIQQKLIDFMITCNHVSADGQFDSDASVQAGAVNSERLTEGEKSVSLYYIVFMYRRHWTDDV